MRSRSIVCLSIYLSVYIYIVLHTYTYIYIYNIMYIYIYRIISIYLSIEYLLPQDSWSAYSFDELLADLIEVWKLAAACGTGPHFVSRQHLNLGFRVYLNPQK